MVAAMASEGARLGVWTHSFLSFVIPQGIYSCPRPVRTLDPSKRPPTATAFTLAVRAGPPAVRAGPRNHA